MFVNANSFFYFANFGCRLYGADPKVLKFSTVHMKKYRRSGLLISKFRFIKAFYISNKLCGGDSTKSCFLRNRDF